jgi:negative regulator of replication initiation
MLIAIIIALIIGLVIIAIVANVLQQQKEKQDAERRAEMAKFRSIIEETEAVISNDLRIPISRNGFIILYSRVLAALKKMNQLMPNQRDIMARMQDCAGKIESADFNIVEAETIKIPENDKLLIAMIQAIKKYRTILHTENAKGLINSAAFQEEDRKVERLQLRINIESQVRRGRMAQNNGMIGSARQYFEKAMTTLDAQPFADEYILAMKQEVKSGLEQIAAELNASSKPTKPEQGDEDNLDALFAPKKKW